MTHFHIEGLPPFDGDYPLDVEYFTNKELHLIKNLSGVRAGELQEAFAAGDNDLNVSLAVIALQRSGKQMPPDAVEVLWNAKVGQITLVAEEDEESPPVDAPTLEPSESGGARSEPSGPGLRSVGDDPPANGRSSTGQPVLAIGSDSAPVT